MTSAPGDSDERLAIDVEEFAVHDRKGGWARALLVARRVEPGEGKGERTDLRPRYGRNAVFRRTSAREFAQRSGTSTQRILAFFDAWQRACEDGLVPPAHELTPGIHVELPDEEAVPFFGEHGYYRSYQARMKDGERRQAIEQEAERAGVKPTALVYMTEHPKALKTAILADSSSRTAAKEAIAEFERREAEADAGARVAARQVAEEHDQGFDRAEVTPDGSARDEEAADIERAVRSVSREDPEPDVALQVFSEMTTVRLATLRALSLLQRNQVQFTDDRSRAIADLCDSSEAALTFIRDLAAGPYAALNDEALQAFLDESEKKLG